VVRDVVVVVVCALFVLLLLSVGAWIGRAAERRAPRRLEQLKAFGAKESRASGYKPRSPNPGTVSPELRRLRGFAGRDELEVRDPGDAA
jgi:hypothetical protein